MKEKDGGNLYINMIATKKVIYDSTSFAIRIRITGKGKWKIKDDALSPMTDISSIHSTFEQIPANSTEPEKESIALFLSSNDGYKCIDTLLTTVEKRFITNFIGYKNGYWPNVKIDDDKLSFSTSQGIETYIHHKEEHPIK